MAAGAARRIRRVHVVRLVLFCPALLLVPLGFAPARAEDFTGFYAGVNAGYAFDRDRHERDGAVTFPDTASSNDAPGLPPSALNASQSPAMRDSRGARSDRTGPR